MVLMAEKIDLPPGFRFYPNDQELISCYLKPKILGQKLLCNIINNTELYGPDSTPWQLFDVNDDDSWIDSHKKESEKVLYVFTTLSKLRTSDSNRARSRDNTCKKAGCGTWGGKTKREPIRDRNGSVIGEKRMLVFEINDVGDRFDLSKAGYFKMHEYSLCGVNKGLKSAAGVGDVVLCKITFDSSKKPIFKLASKSTDHGPKNCGEIQNKFENLEGSVGDKLGGIGNLTSKSVVVMHSGVGDHIEGIECLTSENLCEMDNYGFGDFDDYLASADQYVNEFVEDPSFDMDWFIDVLTSDQEDGPIEDISMLGKRKLEEENLCGTKKMCLR